MFKHIRHSPFGCDDVFSLSYHGQLPKCYNQNDAMDNIIRGEITMNAQVKLALDTAIRNWNAMSKSNFDEAEGSADQFESSFYTFIDAVREWAYSELRPLPQTIEQFLALP